MATTTFIEELTFTVISCCECHMPFGVTEALYRRLRQGGRSFYCPACGCRQHFTESELDKLKAKLKTAEESLRRRDQQLEVEREAHLRTRRQLNGTKGALAKTKKRIAAGVCPCCQRSFENLRRHMEAMHPEYMQADDQDSA